MRRSVFEADAEGGQVRLCQIDAVGGHSDGVGADIANGVISAAGQIQECVEEDTDTPVRSARLLGVPVRVGRACLLDGEQNAVGSGWCPGKRPWISDAELKARTKPAG